MPRLSLIKPLDQPSGNRRLLDELRTALQDQRFSDLRFVIAFAKSGPLDRLRDALQDWSKSGKSSAAIFGIDLHGTSKEALELALSLFDSVYVTNVPRVTFHPKIYIFKGYNDTAAFIGSNNLTVGGTETNFEAAVKLEIDSLTDQHLLDILDSVWTDLLPNVCPATVKLNYNVLERLVENGEVVAEEHLRTISVPDQTHSSASRSLGTYLNVKPESPLPEKHFSQVPRTPKLDGPDHAVPNSTTSLGSRRHVIQIKPHHNGEVLLSISAVLENPKFFNWPFTGKTTPKRQGNPSYPQLVPDPIVNIVVFGASPEPLLTLNRFHLNTVFYERRSEVRITISPIVSIVPDYSVMIMDLSDQDGISYEIVILTPDNPNYNLWTNVCNRSMPSGGKQPRKYGWF